MWTLKLISLFLILFVTLLSGLYPFFRKLKSSHAHDFPGGESLAAGVFLGAGLIHMLGGAAKTCYALHIQYPLPFVLAGLTFLFFLLFEHVSREVYQKEHTTHRHFAILALIMLSIHGFLTGTALGLSTSISMALIIFAAIVAHQWAESFSLAILINKSYFSFKAGFISFFIFASMVPLGILCGSVIVNVFSSHPLLEPIFSSLSAGTFLYLGTLHGLERATLVKQCCELNRFLLVIFGFLLMAIVAIWT